MPLPIVIDVGVTDPPRELSGVLLEACSRAAAETTCYLMREAPESPYAAIAIITWEQPDRVRVEVGLRRETGAEWRSRQIAFRSEDADVERYRSVGFVVGTLATSPTDEAPPATDREEPAAALPPPLPPAAVTSRKEQEAKPAPPVQPQSSSPHGFVGLSAFVGTGLSEGGPRFGGYLRAGIRVVPRLSLLVAAGVSSRPRDDQGFLATWMDAGLGVGYAVLGRSHATHLALRAEFLGEHFSAEAKHPDTGAVMERGRTIPAARVGVDGVLMMSPIFGFVAGIDGTLRSSLTEIDVQSQDAGSTLYLEPGATLGLRVEL